jgi:hypothetical protein
MKRANWMSKNRSSDPSRQNKTRYGQFVQVVFGGRGLIGQPSPLTPLQNAAAGRAGHPSSSPGGVEAKKLFEFQDRISGAVSKCTRRGADIPVQCH